MVSFGKKEKKQLLYSYKMGQEEDKTRIINRATVRIMADRITRKYSPRNVIRKLLELREFAEMNYRSLLIVGGGFTNKGAEAMVLTVARAARKKWSDSKIYVRCPVSYFQIARSYGLIPVNSDCKKSVVGRLKSKIRAAYSYYKCDAVIDVGGYQFGDPWGVKHAWNGYHSVKKCSCFGTPKFFMPQAWGPFSSEEFCNPIAGILNSAKLCFVRDHFSQHEIAKLLGAIPSNTFFSHDVAWNFTGFDLETGKLLLQRYGIAKKGAMLVCITPNLRVYERHEGDGVNNEYIRFLRKVISGLCRYPGLQIFLMGHVLRRDGDKGTGDGKLCRFLMQLLQGRPQVVHVDGYLSADEVKAIIGNCNLVISSRYHALIAALSQGVPSIAIGWSQKYNELMSQVGLPDSVLTIEDDEDHISDVIDFSMANRDVLSVTINQNVVRFKRSAHDAMTRVLDAIESKS